MSIRDTAYFREFLDFAFLWMRDNGRDVPQTYRPTPENEALWAELNEMFPIGFFERCPMHWLGQLLNRPQIDGREHPLVLAVSLEPGRPQRVEEREDQAVLFSEFGNCGDTLIEHCTNYFEYVYGIGGINIVRNPFWRIISRISFRAFNVDNFENHQCFEWMNTSIAHVDLWPLRSQDHAAFMAHQAHFPDAFGYQSRCTMVLDLINAARPDLVLLLGAPVQLELHDWQPVPQADNDGFQNIVEQSTSMPRIFRCAHPAARGITNRQWNAVGARINLALQN